MCQLTQCSCSSSSAYELYYFDEREGIIRFFMFAGEEKEGECQESRVKGRKRQCRDRSSSISPTAPEVKVQKVEEECGEAGDGVEGELELSEDPMEAESGHGLPTEGYWAHYQSLCHTLPGRERQIEELLTLFGMV